MFLPLLNASKTERTARAMIGKVVYVYTTRVDALHVQDHEGPSARRGTSSSALNITNQRLWLQTSEGPNSSCPEAVRGRRSALR